MLTVSGDNCQYKMSNLHHPTLDHLFWWKSMGGVKQAGYRWQVTEPPVATGAPHVSVTEITHEITSHGRCWYPFGWNQDKYWTHSQDRVKRNWWTTTNVRSSTFKYNWPNIQKTKKRPLLLKMESDWKYSWTKIVTPNFCNGGSVLRHQWPIQL